MSRTVAALATIERWFAVGAATTLAAMMVVVFVDVSMRYAFNAPLAWSYEGVGLFMMPATFFLMLAYTYRQGHHVNVDVVLQRVSPRCRRLSSLLSAALAAPIFGAMAVLAGLESLEGYEQGRVLGGAIPWPTWVPLAIAAAGLGLFTLRLLLQVGLVIVLLLRPDAAVAGFLAGDSPRTEGG